MRFDENDIQYLSAHARMHYWLCYEEGTYALACGGESGSYNLSAAIAFEKYFGRVPWLWAEKTKTPERLAIGSQFTWQGHLVSVTSFNDGKKSLIACTVQHEEQTVSGRRFRITHDELMAKRKEYDDLRSVFEKRISAARELLQLDEIQIAIGASGTTSDVWRHFDLDILRDLIKRKHDAISRTMDDKDFVAFEANRQAAIENNLDRWIAGEDIRQHFSTIRIRINGQRLEVSNGNSVALAAARKALSFAAKFRKKAWKAQHGRGTKVENFEFKEIHPTNGVTIGCTVFPWSEIERFKTLLSK
jgi:hypothetical protein